MIPATATFDLTNAGAAQDANLMWMTLAPDVSVPTSRLAAAPSGAAGKSVLSVAIAALLFGAGPLPGPVQPASQAVSLASIETAFSRQ